MSEKLFCHSTCWASEVWKPQRETYMEEVAECIQPLLRVSRHGKPHPVYDFLFEYYRFRPNQLKAWSPGFDVFLEGASIDDLPALASFNEAGGYIAAAAFPEQRREGLEWVIELLCLMQSRPAFHSCFGLHEWAMVYQTKQPRHSVPLRFSVHRIKEIVDSHPLTCTHYDAFRFFTESAAPRNRIQLNKENRIQHDQPGCIHANMDLYKWSYKFYPWISSARIFAAFQLALEARILDMRASPYDLTEWGVSPVKIETPEGKIEYECSQRKLAEAAVPIRRALLEDLQRFRKALTPSF